MAEGLVSETVQKAVDECNKSLENIDSGIGELDVIDELKGYVSELAAVWQTEGGEETIAELNKNIDNLKKYTDSLKRAMQDIKNDKYTFTKTKDTKIVLLSDLRKEG